MASSETYIGSKKDDAEEVYYLRLFRLIAKHGTYVLRCKLDMLVPQLQNALNVRKNNSKLQNALKKKIINTSQWDQLYPTPKPEDFDITLLMYLLRNICGLDSSSKWWAYKDNSHIPKHKTDLVADLVRIRNLRNKLHHKYPPVVAEKEFESEWNLAEGVMLRLTNQCGITDFQQTIDDAKVSQLDLISEELRNMRGNSATFFKHHDQKMFVETSAYKLARDHLEKNTNAVLITGNPGEGKTTVATRLALNKTELRNCLVLARPSDWRYVNLSLKIINTIIIDDIFGPCSLDEKMIGEWRTFLPEIDRAATQKEIQVIITSRKYIFEEARDELFNCPVSMFDCEILLTSAELSEEEKVNIFKSQARRSHIELPIGLITKCVMASAGENTNVLFGFPECVSMFVNHYYNENDDDVAEFFKKPVHLFKKYLLQLYKSRPKQLRDKFLALVAVWSKEDKILSEQEFARLKNTSCHVQRVAQVFDRGEVDADFLETIETSLKSHDGGFLRYTDKSGQYAFSHNVIGDMVGLVIAENKPEQAIEICPRDFLIGFVGVGEHQENTFTLKEKQYPWLVKRMVYMILRKNCNEVANIYKDDFQSLKRSGKRQSTVEVHSTLDFGLIKHKAFKHKPFVDLFITYVVERKYVKEMFQTPVMSMTGYFLDYGISIGKLDMHLLDYAWFIGARTFATEIFENELVEKVNKTPSVALLLAVHSRDVDSVDYLLRNGTKVTGDALYIAIHNRIDHILQLLLKHPGTDVNDRGNAVHGNFPLIVASRKGFTEAVKCLLQYNADPGVTNTSNMTALHKAIIYKRREIIEALVERHAPLDVRGGKFKRTPLHIAVDMGDLELVKLFLVKGASVLVKDHRGHYPIHIAAIKGNHEIVRTLRPVDKSQETHRISSYGTRSKITGFLLYHIAVWKKDEQLLKILIEMGVNPNGLDWYGQTALYLAIMEKKEAIASVLLDNERTDKQKGQKQGFTPLHAAIYKRLTEVALKLIPHSNVNAQDKYGKTPLHGACEKMDVRVIDCLLENGVNVKTITKRGDTIFHILRRNMGKRSEDPAKAKVLETYFAMYYPDFVQELPKLKNRSGITIEVHAKASDVTQRPPLREFVQCNRTSADSGTNKDHYDLDDDDGDDDDDDIDFDDDDGAADDDNGDDYDLDNDVGDNDFNTAADDDNSDNYDLDDNDDSDDDDDDNNVDDDHHYNENYDCVVGDDDDDDDVNGDDDDDDNCDDFGVGDYDDDTSDDDW